MSELCLVTGGAGFIGSHLVAGLTAAGHRVRILDDLSTGLRDNLAGITPSPEVVVGNITDPAAVARAIDGVHVVYHLAAIASVQRSLEDPGFIHEVCATGTLRVLEASHRAKVRRVVYAGSASAYGIPPSDVQTESDPLTPLSPYAAAKLAGEMYCQAFTGAFALETVRLRFFNVFGPRQRADSPYSGVIAIFAAALLAGRPPTVHGDGLQSRDFVHVSDVVQALRKAADTPGVGGRVYNVGTGRSVSVLDLVASLNRALRTNVQPRHGPARAGDVRHSRAAVSQITRELAYRPAVAFEDGLAETVRWLRAAAVR